jgi:hypothetical protein
MKAKAAMTIRSSPLFHGQPVRLAYCFISSASGRRTERAAGAGP